MDKREAIYQAALNLFNTRGFYNTPVSEVSKAANVATGTIYHYFPSKEDMILNLYSYVTDSMHRSLVRKFDGRAPFQEQFARFWKNLFDFYIKNEGYFLFLVQFDNSPFRNNLTHDEWKKPYLPLYQFIEKGMKTRILKSIDIDIVLSMLRGGIIAVAKAHIDNMVSIDPAKVYKSIEISWKGLKID